MKIRHLFAVAALFIAANPAFAVEPVPKAPKPTFGFSTMKPAKPEDAKAKAKKWLQAAGKFDQAAFDAIWKDNSRTVLDRTADSLALGSREAATLLESVRKADAAAPPEVPAILKDAKQDLFFRTNVALAFAKAAASKMAYEEALEALKSVNPEHAVDPATYYFFKAVSEHALLRKEAAIVSVVNLLEEVSDSPARYTMIATLMYFDMQNWSPDSKDLSNIEKLMNNSGRRLELARAGERTQDIQKKIIFRLQELIQEMEAKKHGPTGKLPNCPPGGDKPAPPGNNPGPGNVNPTQPAPRSDVMGGDGDGNVTNTKLKQIAEQWGNMPPEKRAQVVQEITRELPPRFEPFIKSYFQALDRLHGYKK